MRNQTVQPVTKLSKNFDESAVIKDRMILSLRAVTDDGMIPFAAYTSAETSIAVQWAGQLPKIAPFL